MANLFIEYHSSNPKHNSFRNGNCFIIASTLNEYSLQEMLLKVVAEVSTRLLLNAL